MASSFTTNKYIEKPASGGYVDAWASPVNADWDVIDAAFGAVTSLNVVSVSGTVTLTAAQYRPPMVVISGLLTANVNYQIPAGVGGQWVVYNNTTGLFTVTISSAGGGSTVLPYRDSRTNILCDGTNVLISAASTGANYDITSINGLTTPLSAAQGGTGASYYEPSNPGMLNGYICTNNITYPLTFLSVAAGICRDSTNVRNIQLVTPMAKNLTAVWAAGNNNGGRDSATALAPGQTWHVFAILDATAPAVDVLFSQSPTAPIMPSGYVYFRRIMSIILEAASTSIRQFIQTGNNVALTVRGVEWAGTANGPASSYLRTVGVPTGLKLLVSFFYQSTGVGGSGANPAFSGIYDPDVGVPTFGTPTQWAQIRASWNNSNDRYQTRIVEQWCNTAAQVYTASNDTGDVIAGGVLSWVDQRGIAY
jgi:hypothetical protein